MKRLAVFFILLFNFFVFSSLSVRADNIMTLSGYLHDDKGDVIADGTIEFRVTMWNNRDDDNSLGIKADWQEIYPFDFSSSDMGKFEISIGSKSPISDSVIENYPYVQLEIRDTKNDDNFEILDPLPDNTSIDRLDFTADTLFFSNNIFTINQQNQFNSETGIQFGDSLEAFIKYSSQSNIFDISKSVNINGDLNVTGLINGRDLVLDGATLDKINSTEKIIDSINASQKKINISQIDFNNKSENEFEQTYIYNLAKDTNYQYDQNDTEDMLTIANGKISVKDSEFVSMYGSFIESDKFANSPAGGTYSAADNLIYIVSKNNGRVFGIDPVTKKTIHEIGIEGKGKGGIEKADGVDISSDGLLMAINVGDYHFVSVWKRSTIQDKWTFAFDLGGVNLYANVSDGTRFWWPKAVAIRNSDKHIFVGCYNGLTKNFNTLAAGLGGVAEYDSNGKFVDIPLRYGKKGKIGKISQGEARNVLDITFDTNDNLWVRSAYNEIGSFNTQTWNLNSVMLAEADYTKFLTGPLRMAVIGENQDKIIVTNKDFKYLRIYNSDAKIIDSFGYNHLSTYGSYDKPLGISNNITLMSDKNKKDFYIIDQDNNNIKKVQYGKMGTTSRIIFPEIELKNLQKLYKLIITKKQNGDINKIRFQCRFSENDNWIDIPENGDMSDIAVKEDKIQIAAIFQPTLKINTEYSSDIVDGVRITYSVIKNTDTAPVTLDSTTD